MIGETLAGTQYRIRPDYDALAQELGEPPLGLPPECEFHWPETSDSALETMVNHTRLRDGRGRFTKGNGNGSPRKK